MYDRVVSQLLSTESCQLEVFEFLIEVGALIGTGDLTREASIGQKVGESHCDYSLCTGMALVVGGFDVGCVVRFEDLYDLYPKQNKKCVIG